MLNQMIAFCLECGNKLTMEDLKRSAGRKKLCLTCSKKKRKCIHLFQSAHGSTFGDNTISYHGKCKNCNIEMSMYGQLDEQGNGEVIISAVDGYKTKKKIRKGQI